MRKIKSNNKTNATAAEKRLKACLKAHREVLAGEHAVMLGNVTATEVVLSLSEPTNLNITKMETPLKS